MFSPMPASKRKEKRPVLGLVFLLLRRSISGAVIGMPGSIKLMEQRSYLPVSNLARRSDDAVMDTGCVVLRKSDFLGFERSSYSDK